MAVIPVADINALSDIAVIVSSLFLFYRWRKRNFGFAISFLPIAFVFAESLFLDMFIVSGTIGFLLRGVNSVILTVALAHACTRILRNSKKLYPVFALYALFPLSFFITNDPIQIYIFIRFIGAVILLPYFILLFAVEHHEIKAVSFLGTSAIASAVILWLVTLMQPQSYLFLPLYVPRVLLALLLLGLAHFTIHMPDGIIDHHFRKRRKR